MISMLRRSILAPVLISLLAACSPGGGSGASFVNTDITGASYGKDFRLTDHTGAARSLADYRGKVVTLFFGYVQCPDVCPTNLLNMVEVMKQLGPDADKVQVLFMTIDPERDTQALLAEYVPAFDPRFIGLSGPRVEIDKAIKAWRVYARKVDGKNGDYTMDHTAGVFLFHPDGRFASIIDFHEDRRFAVPKLRRTLS